MATTPPQPFWLQIVRGIQLLLAVVTLGLSAYALSVVGGYSGYGLNIFTTIVTIFYIAYIITSSFIAPNMYNIWTSLALQAFLCIFWLATFGTLAAASVAYSIDDSFDHYDSDEWFYSVHTGDYVSAETAKVVVNTTKASAALTAFIWVSFVATLIYTSMFPQPQHSEKPSSNPSQPYPPSATAAAIEPEPPPPLPQTKSTRWVPSAAQHPLPTSRLSSMPSNRSMPRPMLPLAPSTPSSSRSSSNSSQWDTPRSSSSSQQPIRSKLAARHHTSRPVAQHHTSRLVPPRREPTCSRRPTHRSN